METNVTHTVESLYESHQERIRHYFLKCLMDSETAEDLTQDVFVRLSHVAAKKGLPDNADLIVDLIARGKLRDHKKQMGRRPTSTTLAAAEHEAEKAAAGGRPYPTLTYDTAEFRADFDRAVRDLPADERDVFILQDLRGLTEVEAAEYVGVSRATVGRRHRAAQARMKAALG